MERYRLTRNKTDCGGHTASRPKRGGRPRKEFLYQPCPSQPIRHFLTALEKHQRAVAAAVSLLVAELRSDPDLRAQYDSFVRAGGVSAEDWRRYQRGEKLRGMIGHRQHLRLLVDNDRRPRDHA